VPVALISIVLVFGMLACAIGRRKRDDFTLLAATVSLALLGNAFVCGVISGPHDRYGSRLAWIATFVVLIATLRRLTCDDELRGDSLSLGEEIQHA
jgi:peptidoglycan/LPS O-acetylase OafA/YrhL